MNPIKLLTALWVAFLVTLGERGWWAVWPGVKGVVRALWAWASQKVDERAVERLEGCARCPLYHLGKGTCGWEGGPVDWQGKPMGCLCYMPLKVRLREANCWLYEQGVGGGWKGELNGEVASG